MGSAPSIHRRRMSLRKNGALREFEHSRRKGISELPMDCILEITSFFETGSNANSFMRTCKFFYRCFNDNHYGQTSVCEKILFRVDVDYFSTRQSKLSSLFAKSFFYNYVKNVELNFTGSKLARRSGSIRTISPFLSKWNGDQAVVTRALKTLKHFPYLSSIAMVPIARKPICFVSDSLIAKLREIEMKLNKMLNTYLFGTKKERIFDCSQLEEISFSGQFFPIARNALRNCHNLKCLRFNFGSTYSPVSFSFDGRTLQKLNVLSFHYSPTSVVIDDLDIAFPPLGTRRRPKNSIMRAIPFWKNGEDVPPNLSKIEFSGLSEAPLRYKVDRLVYNDRGDLGEVPVEVSEEDCSYQEILKGFMEKFPNLETNICVCNKWSKFKDLLLPKASEISFQGEVRCRECSHCSFCTSRLIARDSCSWCGEKVVLKCWSCGPLCIHSPVVGGCEYDKVRKGKVEVATYLFCRKCDDKSKRRRCCECGQMQRKFCMRQCSGVNCERFVCCQCWNKCNNDADIRLRDDKFPFVDNDEKKTSVDHKNFQITCFCSQCAKTVECGSCGRRCGCKNTCMKKCVGCKRLVCFDSFKWCNFKHLCRDCDDNFVIEESVSLHQICARLEREDDRWLDVMIPLDFEVLPAQWTDTSQHVNIDD